MVDRAARDQFAQLLRHFVAGNITNLEYEDAADRIFSEAERTDRVLWAIRSRLWFYYDDIRTHKMRGKHTVLREGRREIARWIVFLYSNSEYEWPIRNFISLSGCLLRFLTLGLAEFLLGPAFERRMNRLGRWDLWPFFREFDFQLANAHPRLLRGYRSNPGA